MKFFIDKEAAQALLSYLATRPYAEVFRLIPLLQAPNLSPLEKEPHETSSEDSGTQNGEYDTEDEL